MVGYGVYFESKAKQIAINGLQEAEERSQNESYGFGL